MKLNEEQAKHLADTARLVAIAQFASFGYTSFAEQQYLMTILSALVFAEFESLALLLLGDK